MCIVISLVLSDYDADSNDIGKDDDDDEKKSDVTNPYIEILFKESIKACIWIFSSNLQKHFNKLTTFMFFSNYMFTKSYIQKRLTLT